MAASNPLYGESTSDGGHLYPISVLNDELNNENLEQRLNAVKKLSTFALALGVKNTKKKLIPFLTHKIQTAEDEDIFMELAETLGNFTQYVGGSAFVHTLLPPLKELAGAEEINVREKAVESLCKIAALHSPSDLEKYFVNLISYLVSDEWFTSRWSATGLFSVAYPRVSTMIKSQLHNYYSKLCKDDTPLVRRAAAGKLKEFAEIVDLDSLKNRVIPLFSSLVLDEQESVCVLSLDAYASIASRLGHEDLKKTLLPLLHNLSENDSWNVRFKVVDILTQIQKVVELKITLVNLVPIFLRLLCDTQNDVRRVAALRICDFCHNLCFPVVSGTPSNAALNAAKMSDKIDVLIMTSILPAIKELVSDTNEQVRMALSSSIMGFASILGKQRTIEHLIPQFLTLLSDECSEVRLNIIMNLDCVNEVIGIELLSEILLPAVLEHSNDPNWRVHLAVIEYIPWLACQLDSQLFTEKYLNLCISWLTNHVYAIREASPYILKKLIEFFGRDWAEEFLIPKVLRIAKDSKYLNRISFLFCITELADVCGPEIIAKTMLPIVLSMGNDYVANVRFNVAKTLGKISPTQSADVKSQIKSILDKLSTDKDMDVQYFAAEAISGILWN